LPLFFNNAKGNIHPHSTLKVMKSFFLFLLLIITISSCERKTNQASGNQAIIKQLYEYFNKHEWQKMADLYVEVADFKDPSFGIEITKQTRQQTIQKYTDLAKIFPDIHDEVVQIYPSGENVIVVEFVSTGTAADGTKFKLPICAIFTIENGKIAKDFTYYDNQ
jgi:ketosteroid isomerase-like protein